MPQKPLHNRVIGGTKTYERPRRFTFNRAKDIQNKREHGLSLNEAERFEFDSALVEIDTRVNYREEREVAIGFIGARLHTLVFTMRANECRIISLRKAIRPEMQIYVENT